MIIGQALMVKHTADTRLSQLKKYVFSMAYTRDPLIHAPVSSKLWSLRVVYAKNQYLSRWGMCCILSDAARGGTYIIQDVLLQVVIQIILVPGSRARPQPGVSKEIGNGWPVLAARQLIRVHVASIRELHPGAGLWIRYSILQISHLGWWQQLIL